MKFSFFPCFSDFCILYSSKELFILKKKYIEKSLYTYQNCISSRTVCFVLFLMHSVFQNWGWIADTSPVVFVLSKYATVQVHSDLDLLPSDVNQVIDLFTEKPDRRIMTLFRIVRHCDYLLTSLSFAYECCCS